MKSDSRQQLLDDVLQEEQSFHERVIHEMVRQARRRRYVRQAIRGTAALLVTGLTAALLVNRKSDLPSPAVANNVPVPAQHFAIVETRVGSLTVLSSSPGAVTMVETVPKPVEQVSDERLLAMVARPAALVWRTPSQAELVFADNESESQ